jgi:membrane protein
MVGWILASVAFGYYVSNFGNYSAMYGSLGAMLVLLFYFFLSAAILLFGAEINAVVEHKAGEGKGDMPEALHAETQSG